MCASLASVCTKHSLVPVCTHSPAWILFAVKRYRHVREARRRWSASVAAGQAWLEYFRDVSLTGACAVGDSCYQFLMSLTLDGRVSSQRVAQFRFSSRNQNTEAGVVPGHTQPHAVLS